MTANIPAATPFPKGTAWPLAFGEPGRVSAGSFWAISNDFDYPSAPGADATGLAVGIHISLLVFTTPLISATSPSLPIDPAA